MNVLSSLKRGVKSLFSLERECVQRERERDFYIGNFLVRIHFIIEMIWWTGLAPWELESLCLCSPISTFL